jgi:uncharacterized small protein (DUF1192 family)
MDSDKIKERIAQLQKELNDLVAEANRQIGMKQGAIAELERMLEVKE